MCHDDSVTTSSLHFDQNSSDSSTICNLNNVVQLPPIGYDYQQPHGPSTMNTLMGPNSVPPPALQYTVVEEQQYSRASVGTTKIGGGSGSSGNCSYNMQNEVKTNTRVRSYESERGILYNITSKYLI